MLFNSTPFIFFFLPISVVGFYLLGCRSRMAAQLWLCACSLIFYGYWNPIYLPVLIGSVLVNYGLGRALAKASKPVAFRRTVLAAGVAGNLGVLGYFKYSTFFLSTANDLLSAGWVVPMIVLPIGISFITFQKIGYLVDVYRKPKEFSYSLLQFTLFVTFFPQLIAGPIVRHHEILPQFARSQMYRFDSLRTALGISIFLIALFKKSVIADSLAGIATPLFNLAAGHQLPSFADAWLGVLAYTLQIYFDFSAYSEMAAGLAILFGVKLPVNFASPYKSTSMIEFWRRWHISLSRFLRDYLYIPLGGNRRGPARRMLNVMTTMLLGGLWHGAGWTYVAWGALHGAAIVTNQLFKVVLPSADLGRISRALSWLLTMVTVIVGWIFFRAQSFETAMLIIRSMVDPFTGAPTLLQTNAPLAFAIVALLAVFVLAMPNVPELFRAYSPMLNPEEPLLTPSPFPTKTEAYNLTHFQWRPTAGWAFAVSAMAICSLLAILLLRTQAEFLYFQF